ncbi:MAG: anthranilate phosphoribosyltransferase, partial [Aeromicrobium sp.]
SSSSGTADVFEVLGIRLDVRAARIPEVFTRSGITFCFAPVFHPSFRHTAVPRRELGIATPFNFLGPLTNPAQPAASAIGCADVRMAPLMAGVLAARGHDAFVFRGEDGLDEITITDATRVWEVSGGDVVESLLDPRELGFTLAPPESLRGADPEFNAEVFRRVVGGEVSPVRDAVLLNAGAAIAAHEAAGGELLDRLASGVERARGSIDSGSAAETLSKWAAATQELAG